MKQAGKLAHVPRTRRQPLMCEEGAEPQVMVRELSEVERAAEAAEAEPATVLERLAPLHAQRIQDYIKYSQGMCDPETGRKLTDREIAERAHADAEAGVKWAAERARKAPLREVEWRELGALSEEDPAEAIAKWEAVKQAARDELTSGFRCADIAGESLRPFDRARFIAIHEQLVEGWQPRNGIEHSLVDMLAQAFSLYQYWTQIAHARAVGICDDLREEGRETGYWPRPKQDVADAIGQAQRLADGYHRQYMRTLRQMRDLRRYAPPVIVNNGGQVNVAADGGQQVNVSK